jgi:hypothetical protein
MHLAVRSVTFEGQGPARWPVSPPHVNMSLPVNRRRVVPLGCATLLNAVPAAAHHLCKTNEGIMKKYLPQIALLSMAVSGIAAAVGPPDAKVPDEVASRIKRFVGHWTYEMTSNAGDNPAAIKGTQECTLAVGGVGVQCTLRETRPDGTHDTLQLIGYDSGNQVIVFTQLNDHGIVETFPAAWQGDSFTQDVNGKDPAGGQAAKVLAKSSFGSDGNSITQHVTVRVGGALRADLTTVFHRVK